MQLTAPPDFQTTPALKLRSGRVNPVFDDLVVEGVLQIRISGEPYSVTMRTPGDDENLALGLLFAEGVIDGIDSVMSCAVSVIQSVLDRDELGPEGNSVTDGNAVRDEGADGCVDVVLRTGRLGPELNRRRLASNASCGACGMISAEDLSTVQSVVAGGQRGVTVSSMLPWLENQMQKAQSLFRKTGGSHAAALFNLEGSLLVLKEDVGRHNAVDKAIGCLLREGRLSEATILLISGRVSYEIVSKAAKAGIQILLAVSAPSTLAVKLCDEAGIALVGFCRGGDATIYTHAEKVGITG